MALFNKAVNKAGIWTMALCATVLFAIALVQRADAQDDDPPSRVARLGYTQGSVSFQPAGESEWVEAIRNRPMISGDRIWADRDSRAELELGSAVIDLNSNTGISFLNLADRTAQIELSSGIVNFRVRHLKTGEVFEIDTPNQAFSIFQPGRYRLEASEDGSYTVVSIREGEGESTGNGQTYRVQAGQRATFQGTTSLDAQVEDLTAPDDFDAWCYRRYDRYENARSARYVSRDVVGYEDLDDYGDWQPNSRYGYAWFPQVQAGWAPYREGHWAWIDPWGWTWVDEEPWGYAPFHYGRWLFVEGRWGWVPGPVEVAPVYAPALVVFLGGGGFASGGAVAWFPLGPQEVYVPAYRVSREYVNRINFSDTTVNTTTITSVYNTTIVNNNTTISNVTYINRNVSGAVTAVPQQAFVSAQPVAKAAVQVNAQQVASAPLVSRASVTPTNNSVLGVHAATANRVAAPPTAVASRTVIAKAATPPPPVPFAARQQTLAAHPGQPIARHEMQQMRPANAPKAQPLVKQAPPGKPATPTAAHEGNRPASAPASHPPNRPANPPAPDNRQEANRPQPDRPEPNNRQAEPPTRTDRPPSAQPNNRPETNQAKEPPQRNEPAARPPQQTVPPAQTRPAPKEQQRPLTPQEKKRQEEQRKKEEQRKNNEEKPPD